MFQGHIDQDAAMPVEATAIPDVLFERGMYWASGRSGVVNLVAAHKWFNLAALKGRADAIAMRREVAAMMSDAEIADRAARSPRVDDGALTSIVGGRGVLGEVAGGQGGLAIASARAGRTAHRFVDRVKQRLFLQWFPEAGNQARLTAQLDVAMRGDQDGRNCDAVAYEMLLKLQTVHFRHLEIDNQAVRKTGG